MTRPPMSSSLTRTTMRPALARTLAAASTAALLITGCGPDPAPELQTPTVTPSESATTTAAPESAAPTASNAEATTTAAPAPPPAAEAGVLMTDLKEDVPRTGVTKPASGTFGTPEGTLEITSVARADSIPGHVLGGAEPAYVPASGEEFFVVDYTYVRNDDDLTPGSELYVESQGTRRLVRELSQGERSFLVSLPAGGAGSNLVITADGHDQVFDLATGARVADPLTDVYLRRVTQQDLGEVLTYDPVAGYEDRQFTADLRINSARITPYVPPRLGDQRWAEPGSMWLILEFDLEYDATRAGWSERDATLVWTVNELEPVVMEGRLWSPSYDTVVVSVPAESTSFTVAVANQAEVRELGGGETLKDFGTQTFTVGFPQ